MQGAVSALLKKQDDRDGRMSACWLEERCAEEYRGKRMRKKDR